MIVRNLERREVREGDKEEIWKNFRQYGHVTNVWLADDPPGFAYVFFENFKDAMKAVDALHDTRMCGRRVTVELSPSEDKRKNRGGWSNRFGGGGGGGGDRGGDRGGGFRDNYRPRGRGGFRSYDRDYRDDNRGGSRDYDNRGQRSDYRDSYRGRGRGGYNSYRGGGGGGGGYGTRGRGGGYQQRWRGGYGSGNRDDGNYRGRGGFNRDRSYGDNYHSDRGDGGGRYYQSGNRGRGGYYERDSYERRDRREDDQFSDDGGQIKDYEYRESRSYGGEHKEDRGRQKRYSSSPEFIKEPREESRSKYRKRSEEDEFQRHSSSDYRNQGPSSKWEETSPFRQQEGSPGNFDRSRSRSRSPLPHPEYFSPQGNYRSSRKSLDKSTGSFEDLDQYPAMEESYPSSRSFEHRGDYDGNSEPVSAGYSDYRERDRMVKYGDVVGQSEGRSSRHYKSKRAGSEEPIEHEVHNVESSSRYIKIDEKSMRSRGHERSHPRSYASREQGDRDHRRSSPSRHASPPHPKRSVLCVC